MQFLRNLLLINQNTSVYSNLYYILNNLQLSNNSYFSHKSFSRLFFLTAKVNNSVLLALEQNLFFYLQSLSANFSDIFFDYSVFLTDNLLEVFCTQTGFNAKELVNFLNQQSTY